MESNQLRVNAERHLLGRPPRRPHIYYLTVLRLIAAGVRDKLTDAQIAEAIRRAGVQASNDWHETVVCEIRRCIRTGGEHASVWREAFEHAMQEGQIPWEDCQRLLRPGRRGRNGSRTH